jgi:hypothetical protein
MGAAKSDGKSNDAANAEPDVYFSGFDFRHVDELRFGAAVILGI